MTYNFSKFNIDYDSIRIRNKYLSEAQFVKIYSSITTNHFALDSGFINEKIFNNITFGYLDIVQPDNDSIGRQKLRANGCAYKVYASLKPKINDPSYSYIRDRYEIVILDINKNDYEKFKVAMNSVINIAFNNRELEYFELITNTLYFAYSTESYKSIIRKNVIKMKAYQAFLESAIKYTENNTKILEEISEDIQLQDNEDLYGRKVQKGSQ